MSTLNSWRESSLWKLLGKSQDRHAHACKVLLEQVMDQIEIVLAKGATAPKDFTLHDEGHSYRVAQRMTGVACETAEKLTSFELTILLLAAYLHDIGMNPAFERVDGVYRFLLTGKEEALPKQERERLQSWLDDNEYEVVPPITRKLEEDERLRLAREITTYYCRSRHNDWSGEWIAEQFKDKALEGYSGWSHDLKLVCMSHHYGYERLVHRDFDAYKVGGTNPVTINRRYLALLLRIADILEFDPERVPEILIEHRDIAPTSLIYWYKDHEISLDFQPPRLVAYAEPTTARMHKAIEQTIDSIDSELATCKRVMDEYHLPVRFSEEERQRYRWNLPVAVDRDITPREGAYEYIDGAFRPDTKKLLEMLSGTQIYRDKFDAVRELIQNAFDAVAVRIAYQKLSQPNPADPALAKSLAELHRVDLKLFQDEFGTYLECSDDGVGMTKAIIRDRVLVSGSKPKHDVRDLERRCLDAGIELGRSGQFGVGLLSYFMIANRLEIETLRAQESGEKDHAWRFETDGVGSFGELRRGTRSRPGTTVKLRIANMPDTNFENIFQELFQYLERTLVHCPCRFVFRMNKEESKRLEFGPGWSDLDWTSMLIASFMEDVEESATELMSVRKKELLVGARKTRELAGEEIRKRVKWIHSSGSLPDGSANLDIHLPFFELEAGLSFVYLKAVKISEGYVVKKFDRRAGFFPRWNVQAAWKGMSVQLSDGYGFFQPGIVRVNFVNGSSTSIRVDRNSLPELDIYSLSEKIMPTVNKIYGDFLSANCESPFTWLSARIADSSVEGRFRCFWSDKPFSFELDDSLELREVHFPLISTNHLLPPNGVQSRSGESISVAHDLHVTSSYSGINFVSADHEPDRIMVLEKNAGLVACFDDLPRVSTVPWMKAEFPPEWFDVCGCRLYSSSRYISSVVWNSAHPLVSLFTPNAWAQTSELIREFQNPTSYQSELLKDPSVAASWIGSIILRLEDPEDIFQLAYESDSAFLRNILTLFHEQWDSGRTIGITFINHKKTIEIFEQGIREAKNKLPDPSDSWVLRLP